MQEEQQQICALTQEEIDVAAIISTCGHIFEKRQLEIHTSVSIAENDAIRKDLFQQLRHPENIIQENHARCPVCRTPYMAIEIMCDYDLDIEVPQIQAEPAPVMIVQEAPPITARRIVLPTPPAPPSPEDIMQQHMCAVAAARQAALMPMFNHMRQAAAALPAEQQQIIEQSIQAQIEAINRLGAHFR